MPKGRNVPIRGRVEPFGVLEEKSSIHKDLATMIKNKQPIIFGAHEGGVKPSFKLGRLSSMVLRSCERRRSLE